VEGDENVDNGSNKLFTLLSSTVKEINSENEVIQKVKTELKPSELYDRSLGKMSWVSLSRLLKVINNLIWYHQAGMRQSSSDSSHYKFHFNCCQLLEKLGEVIAEIIPLGKKEMKTGRR